MLYLKFYVLVFGSLTCDESQGALVGKVVEVVDPGGHNHDLREEEPDP